MFDSVYNINVTETIYMVAILDNIQFKPLAQHYWFAQVIIMFLS